MNKHITLSMLMSMLWTAAFAQFTTGGDGKSYSLTTLSATAGSGVTKTGSNSYLISSDITIAAGDHFSITDDYSDGLTVCFGDKVTLTVEGASTLCPPDEAAESVTFTRSGASDVPYGVRLEGGGTGEQVLLKGIRFEYLGLMNYSLSDVAIDGCEFYRHNGAQSGALYLASTTAQTTVSGCTFSLCSKAAIGGAANYSCLLRVYDSIFRQNSQDNRNIPQLNLTASQQIIVDGCLIEGDPTKTMVGGIGVSNFIGLTGSSLQVTGCTITDNRYGIGTVGPVEQVRIEDNTLTGNCHETNAMNGGSGISLYDPYQQTSAVIAGNHIEGSLWGVTVIGCKEVNMGRADMDDSDSRGGNVFKDNGNGGQLYDLYNNSTITVYAQKNTWNVAEQTEEEIEKVIYHKADDASLGEVIYWPAAHESAITPVERAATAADSYYSLGGQRLTAPAKGVSIVNGKKVVF